MACRLKVVDKNFIRFDEVSGTLTLASLQASGLPDLCDLTIPVPPAVPTSLVATASGSVVEIDLTWTNTDESTQIEIGRSIISGGSYSTIDTIAAGETTYNDNDALLDQNTTYYYVVNYVGGPDSNEDDARTISFALLLDGVNDFVDGSGFNLSLGDGDSANDFTAFFIWRRDTYGGSGGYDMVVEGDTTGNNFWDIRQVGTINNGEARLVLWEDPGRARRADRTGNTNTVVRSLAEKTCFAVNKISNDNTSWQFYEDAVLGGLGANDSNNLLSTDNVRIKNPQYGDNPFGLPVFDGALKLHIVVQPDMSSSQISWLTNVVSGDSKGRSWTEISSENAKDQGIGISGVDTIGVGGITVLVVMFVDFGELYFSSPNYYVRERVSGTDTHGLLTNFSTPLSSLIIF